MSPAHDVYYSDGFVAGQKGHARTAWVARGDPGRFVRRHLGQ